MSEDFSGTQAKLRHYFGNYAGHARLVHIGFREKDADLERAKDCFIEGLESLLEEGNKETGGVSRDFMHEMLEIARGDWADVAVIRRLYEKHGEIENIGDVDKLFAQYQPIV